MKIKCDWCGSWINDFDQVCPNCGGVNNNYNRHANGVPQTIEELKAWAKEMNLPLEDMRTFIGEDYKGAKAFGIYKDETDGTFVVYKNKEDGTRAVRYKGTDEAYAVNELYQKMKERVVVQKAHQQPKTAKPAPGASAAAQQRQSEKNLSKALFPICLITIVAIIILSVVFALIGESGPDTGYYTYGDRSYYYYGDWYEWENDSWRYAPDESWMESDAPGKMVLPFPMREPYSILALGMIVLLSPITTFLSINTKGPISTFSPIFASGCIYANGLIMLFF